MVEDITTGYPKGYYERKERVSMKISEKLAWIALQQQTDPDFPVAFSLKNFVKKTSFHSALSEKSIIKMILQCDENLAVFFK